MNFDATLQHLDELLRAGQRQELMDAAQKAEASVMGSPTLRDALADAYANRASEAPIWAVFAGSLVEHGASAVVLSRRLLEQVPRMPLEDALPPAGMELLCMASATAWARDEQGRAEARRIPGLAEALARWREHAASFGQLGVVLGALDDEAVVAWFPELQEAFRVRAHGVVSCGQLSALAVDALSGPLRRVGALKSAEPGSGTFGCDFHFFLPAAVDPDTGLPRGRRAVWKAPGGWGDGSLPPDFLLADVPRVGDARVLVVVGPAASDVKFVRVLQKATNFCGMQGRLSEPEALDEEANHATGRALLEHARAYQPSPEEAEFLAQASPVTVGAAKLENTSTSWLPTALLFGAAVLVTLFLLVLAA